MSAFVGVRQWILLVRGGYIVVVFEDKDINFFFGTFPPYRAMKFCATLATFSD